VRLITTRRMAGPRVSTGSSAQIPPLVAEKLSTIKKTNGNIQPMWGITHAIGKARNSRL